MNSKYKIVEIFDRGKMHCSDVILKEFDDLENAKKVAHTLKDKTNDIEIRQYVNEYGDYNVFDF